MGVCNCSMFRCSLYYVHSSTSITIILMGKRELVALLILSSWCLVMVERLFLAVPRVCLLFVIVVFPDHTHLQFIVKYENSLGTRTVGHQTKLYPFDFTPFTAIWSYMKHRKDTFHFNVCPPIRYFKEVLLFAFFFTFMKG